MDRIFDFFTDAERESISLDALKENPRLIEELFEPTELEKLTALRADPYVISVIDDPTYEMQRIVVDANPELVDHIDEPSSRLYDQILREYPDFITRIPYPTNEQKMMALERKASLIQHINATFQMEVDIVRRNPRNIQYIGDPEQVLIDFAIEHDPHVINLIDGYIDEDTMLYAIELDASVFPGIEEPTGRMLRYIVRNAPQYTSHLDLDNEEFQMDMIEESPSLAFTLFKDKSDDLRYFAFKKAPKLKKKYGDTVSEKLKLRMINEQPTFIQHLVNPSIELQTKAVNLEPSVVQYINDVHLSVFLLAHKTLGDDIKKMVVLSENNQVALVRKNYKMLALIQNPSRAAVLEYGIQLKNQALRLKKQALSQLK